MSLLHYDGYKHYSQAQIFTSGQFQSTRPATSFFLGMDATGGRGGGQCIYVQGDHHDYSNVVIRTVAPGNSTGIVGTRFKMNTLSIDRLGILATFDTNAAQVCVGANLNGTLFMRRGSCDGGALLATSTAAISVNQFYYLELKVIHHASAGECYLRVNGVPWCQATGVNTSQTGAAQWNGYALGSYTGGGYIGGFPGFQIRYDDTTCCDGVGAAPYNDFLGDCWVTRVPPTADGFYSNFAITGVAQHFANVDEAIPTDDTDKNTGSAVGDRDSYQYVLPTGTILATMLASYARKNDAGTRKIVDFIRASSVNYDGTTELSLNTEYQYQNLIRLVNPATAAAWAGGATIEQGVKIST